MVLGITGIISGCKPDDVKDKWQKVNAHSYSFKQCADIDVDWIYDIDSNTCSEDNDKSKAVKRLDEDKGKPDVVAPIYAAEIVTASNISDNGRKSAFMELAAAAAAPVDYLESVCGAPYEFGRNIAKSGKREYKCVIGKTESNEDKAILMTTVRIDNPEYNCQESMQTQYRVTMYNLTDRYIHMTHINEYQLTDKQLSKGLSFVKADLNVIDGKAVFANTGVLTEFDAPVIVTTVVSFSENGRSAAIRHYWTLDVKANMRALDYLLSDPTYKPSVTAQLDLGTSYTIDVNTPMGLKQQGSVYIITDLPGYDVKPLFESAWAYQ